MARKRESARKRPAARPGKAKTAKHSAKRAAGKAGRAGGIAAKRKAAGRKKMLAKRKVKSVKAAKWIASHPRTRAAAKLTRMTEKAMNTMAARPERDKGKDMGLCCKDIDIGKWNLRKLVWRRKPFYVVRYGTFFRIPIGIGKAMAKGMEAVGRKYRTKHPEFWLSRETGLFSAKMMFAVEKASASDPNIEELSGTFVTRGFQGPYKNMGNFIRVFKEQVLHNFGKKPEELYFWYANCPKCAPKQGGPKIVIFGKI